MVMIAVLYGQAEFGDVWTTPLWASPSRYLRPPKSDESISLIMFINNSTVAYICRSSSNSTDWCAMRSRRLRNYEHPLLNNLRWPTGGGGGQNAKITSVRFRPQLAVLRRYEKKQDPQNLRRRFNATIWRDYTCSRSRGQRSRLQRNITY